MKFRYFLECLHCATEGIDGKRYRNRSTFYYKEKIYFQNVHFYFSENIKFRTFPRCYVKNNYIFRNYIKNEFYRFNVSFFRDVIFRGGELDLDIDKISIITFYRVIRVHKNDPMAFTLGYVVDSVNANLCAKF